MTIADDDVIYHHGFIHPKTMLRNVRLQVFARVVRKHPPHILGLIGHSTHLQRGWTFSLLEDLKWLSLAPCFADCYGLSLSDWVERVRADGGAFQSKVHRFCKSPFANISTSVTQSATLRAFTLSMPCSECHKVFSSFQALSLHRFKSHGIKNMMRLFVDSTHCSVCLREFWTRERALNHVRYRSPICRDNLIMRGPVLTESQADELDSFEGPFNIDLYRRGRRRHSVLRPSIRCEGPLWPIILPEGCESAHHPLGKGHNVA